MLALYPLLIKPEFHERVWGSHDLSPIYLYSGEQPIGEAWLTGDNCRVDNGPLAGKTLGELASQFREQLVGQVAPVQDRFPLLIKFLFPKEKLSVQVHPDDEGARHIGQPCGKTECWYVLKAEPDAQVGLGLKPGTTKQQFKQAIEQTRAEELLNWIKVAAGDMIYVDAGTVHAIGPGSVLVETQQNSDTTYRLYDYGRPRQLHVEEGLAATREATHAGKVKREEASALLVDSPCFRVVRQRLPENALASVNRDIAASVEILVSTDGAGTLETATSEPLQFSRGDAVVIPASVHEYSIKANKPLEYLSMALPAAGTPPPETYIDTVKAVSK